jgi:hypothetical protein
MKMLLRFSGLCIVNLGGTGIVRAHVPSYGADVTNCAKLKHKDDIDVSQVRYLKGSGGVELDVEDLLTLLDNETNDDTERHIDFEVTFRHAYDVQRFDLYIGCGGCATNFERSIRDPIKTAKANLTLTTYEAKVDPFTQTPYFSLVRKDEGEESAASLLRTQKFPISNLLDCDDEHFSIRLIDKARAPAPTPYDQEFHAKLASENPDDIKWAVAIGLKEDFEPDELLSFPIYIIRNHIEWNGLVYPLPISVFVAVALLLAIACATNFDIFRECQVGYTSPSKKQVRDRTTEEFSYRLAFYGIAAVAFVADIINTLWHFSFAAMEADGASETEALFFVFWVMLARIVCVLVLISSWAVCLAVPRSQRERDENCCLCSSRWFGIAEIGFFVLVLFLGAGAGYFVGPVSCIVAAGFRLLNMPLVSTNNANKDNASAGGGDAKAANKTRDDGSNSEVTTEKFLGVILNLNMN